MNTLLFHVAAFASSFLLTLPAGSCSGWMHGTADSAPAESTCCHPGHHDRAASPLDTPAPTTVDCCCSWDATLPPKGAENLDSSGLAVRFAEASFTTFPELVNTGATVSEPFRYGPRVHVLQCVWRC